MFKFSSIEYLVYGLIIGTIASLITLGKQGEEPKIKLAINMVLVKDTNSCSNSCFHIHHWIWIGIIFIYTMLITGYKSNYSKLMLGLWLSSSIIEFFMYNDTLNLTQKCFKNCKVIKN